MNECYEFKNVRINDSVLEEDCDDGCEKGRNNLGNNVTVQGSLTTDKMCNNDDIERVLDEDYDNTFVTVTIPLLHDNTTV